MMSLSSGPSAVSATLKRKRTIHEEEGTPNTTTTTATTTTTTICPYLDTVNRSLLDFDFEHSCSVSLQSGPHIYGCLVCGKFFLGRGPQTPAHIHSVETGHAVFVHLSRGSFHCLPDDYEITNDPSLSDISAALRPVYSPEAILTLDRRRSLSRDLFGRRYLPGFVGLNNLHKTDYVNATVQALAHVRPLRDYFLRASSTTTTNWSPLALRFGELVRKLWSDQRFKSNVDPHTMIQAVSVASHKRFHIGRQAQAGDFVAWLLHQLHVGTNGGGGGGGKKKKKKKHASIIDQVFRGRVEVTTRQRKRKKKKQAVLEQPGNRPTTLIPEEQPASPYVTEETTISTPFLQLTLDIPEKPLFKDDNGGLVIPQEPLENVLRKFDGESFFETGGSSSGSSGNGTSNNSATTTTQRRYRLVELPDYLILHLKRFKKNGFYTEKNPTIVAFPVVNLDLRPYVKDGSNRNNTTTTPINNNTTTISLLQHRYNLVANITHDSPHTVGREGNRTQRDPLAEGSYRCHVQHRATNQWYEMQDLHVQETMPQLIGLSESYVLIFERQGMEKKEEEKKKNTK